MFKRYCGGNAGFTLIEVLVVLGIIVVIAAVLLPVLISAKRSAKVTSDASNLHQIVLACQLYGQENDDGIPPAVDPATKKLIEEGVRVTDRFDKILVKEPFLPTTLGGLVESKSIYSSPVSMKHQAPIDYSYDELGSLECHLFGVVPDPNQAVLLQGPSTTPMSDPPHSQSNCVFYSGTSLVENTVSCEQGMHADPPFNSTVEPCP